MYSLVQNSCLFHSGDDTIPFPLSYRMSYNAIDPYKRSIAQDLIALLCICFGIEHRKSILEEWIAIEAVFLYCCSDCPSCWDHLNSIGWATWATWAAIKKYSLRISWIYWKTSCLDQLHGCPQFGNRIFV